MDASGTSKDEDPSRDWLPPGLQESYTVRDVLGTGGMGVVFRAWQHSLGREVALKVIRTRAVQEAQEVLAVRFAREVRVLSRISHPRIVRVLDGAITADVAYLAMELLDGETLEKGLPELHDDVQATVRILAEILEGLEHLHGKGIVHRDLKPSNVFLGTDVGAVLIDFGLVFAGAGATRLTRAGDIIGSPRYLAPELIDGGEPSPAGDLFSVGMIACELLTGRHPLSHHASLVQILSSLSSGTYFDDASRILKGRSDLADIILKAVHPDLHTRYREAHLIRRDLRMALQSPTRRGASRSGVGAGTDPTSDLTATSPVTRSAWSHPVRWLPLVLAFGVGAAAHVHRPPVGPVGRPSDMTRVQPTRNESGPVVLEHPDDRGRLGRLLSGLPGTAELVLEVRRAWARRRLPTPSGSGDDSGSAADLIRAHLVAAGIEGGQDDPVPMLESRSWPIDTEVYWRLFWLHGLGVLSREQGHPVDLVLPLFPTQVRPGSRPGRAGRTFQRSLVGGPGLSNNPLITFPGASTFGSLTRSLTVRLELTALPRARRAWVQLRSDRARSGTFLILDVNGCLRVGLTGTTPADLHTFAHSLPLWALREGENVFELRLDSFASKGTNLTSMNQLEIILDP